MTVTIFGVLSRTTLSRRIINLAASGTIKRPHGEKDDSHPSSRFVGGRKKSLDWWKYSRNTSRPAEHGQSHRAAFRLVPIPRGTILNGFWLIPRPLFPSWSPPPSTTFQFILSCWLARFTTKFPLARRSFLHTLYLPFPLFASSLAQPLVSSRYLILFPYIFIFFSV